MSVVGEVMELVTEMRLDTAKFRSELTTTQNRISSFASYASNTLFKIGAAGIAIEGFRAFGEAVKNAEEHMEKLYLTTQKLKIGTEDFQALDFGAEKFGVSSEKLVTAIQFMQNSIGKAVAGKGNSKGVFESLGLDPKELQNLSTNEQLLKISESLAQVKKQTDAVYETKVIFGRGGADDISFLTSNIKKLEESYRSLGLAMTETQLEEAHQLKEDTNLLGRMWESFTNKAPGGIAGLLRTAGGWSEKLNATVGNTSQGVSPLSNQLSDWFSRRAQYTPDFNPNAYLDTQKPNKPLQSELPSITTAINKAMDSFNLHLGDLSSITTKTTNSLTDLASAATSAAKAQRDDAFTSGLKSMEGDSDQINRIIKQSQAKMPNAVDTDFDEVAGRILTDIKKGGKADSMDNVSGIKFLENTIERNKARGLDTGAEVYALKELKDFMTRQSGGQEVKVHISVEPTPLAYIQWYSTTAGKKALNDHIENYTNEQARSAYQ